MTIKAVFFDIGETLINETRVWTHLADLLGVPAMTMFGVLGGLIVERRSHRELFNIVRPDLGWEEVVARFSDEDKYLTEDLYPDVVSTLGSLRQQGYFLGVAGNQPAEREADLRAMNLPVNLLATSGGWGLHKPTPAFFERIAREAGCRSDEIVYVGDRVDNDVIPVSAANMVPIHIVRGPWGYLQRNWPEAALARAQIRSLGELPALLAGL